jgi:hypothetical protein
MPASDSAIWPSLPHDIASTHSAARSSCWSPHDSGSWYMLMCQSRHSVFPISKCEPTPPPDHPENDQGVELDDSCYGLSTRNPAWPPWPRAEPNDSLVRRTTCYHDNSATLRGVRVQFQVDMLRYRGNSRLGQCQLDHSALWWPTGIELEYTTPVRRAGLSCQPSLLVANAGGQARIYDSGPTYYGLSSTSPLGQTCDGQGA